MKPLIPEETEGKLKPFPPYGMAVKDNLFEVTSNSTAVAFTKYGATGSPFRDMQLAGNVFRHSGPVTNTSNWGYFDSVTGMEIKNNWVAQGLGLGLLALSTNVFGWGNVDQIGSNVLALGTLTVSNIIVLGNLISANILTTGGTRFGFRAVSSNTTLTTSDNLVRADASSGAFNVRLPTAVGIAGQNFTVTRINSGVNAVTMETTAGQTISGDPKVALNARWASLTVFSDGANWLIK